jgi:hypothetical protein
MRTTSRTGPSRLARSTALLDFFAAAVFFFVAIVCLLSDQI